MSSGGLHGGAWVGLVIVPGHFSTPGAVLHLAVCIVGRGAGASGALNMALEGLHRRFDVCAPPPADPARAVTASEAMAFG